jgi:hypothetical protein
MMWHFLGSIDDIFAQALGIVPPPKEIITEDIECEIIPNEPIQSTVKPKPKK